MKAAMFVLKEGQSKSDRLLKELVSHFAPQSALLAPSSAAAAAFSTLAILSNLRERCACMKIAHKKVCTKVQTFFAFYFSVLAAVSVLS